MTTSTSIIELSGHILEVGALGMGLKGGKPGLGVMIEQASGGPDIEISGLTREQCKALAEHLNEKVYLLIGQPDL